jgi:Mn2+/Fe2+ NRAMP family transporter
LPSTWPEVIGVVIALNLLFGLPLIWGVSDRVLIVLFCSIAASARQRWSSA